MRKFLLLILLLVLFVFLMRTFTQNKSPQDTEGGKLPDQDNPSTSETAPSPPKTFLPPLDRAAERVTKKGFALYVTPFNSPVRPERFRGYHTGVDFEIFPDELKGDVPVKAICNGKLLEKKYVSGYGGVVIESCMRGEEPVTIVYGHLRLESIAQGVGDVLNQGDTLGLLGANKSVETDGERKHLHLGIHRGEEIDLRGYVQIKQELSNWIDPCQYICGSEGDAIKP